MSQYGYNPAQYQQPPGPPNMSQPTSSGPPSFPVNSGGPPPPNSGGPPPPSSGPPFYQRPPVGMGGPPGPPPSSSTTAGGGGPPPPSFVGGSRGPPPPPGPGGPGGGPTGPGGGGFPGVGGYARSQPPIPGSGPPPPPSSSLGGAGSGPPPPGGGGPPAVNFGYGSGAAGAGAGAGGMPSGVGVGVGGGPAGEMNGLTNGMGGMNLGTGPGTQPPMPTYSQPQTQTQTQPSNPYAPAPDNFAVDCTSIQIPPQLFQTTTSLLPTSNSTASASKLPLGGIIRPFASPSPDDPKPTIPVVQPGSAGIVRCKRCRTYINPFATWFENGRRWKCNICHQLNEVSSSYFCHLDANQKRRDTDQRPELSSAVVEWVAPSEYMVRPPQAPSYFFVIDVSAPAIQSGMLKGVAEAIAKSLDDLPGGERTKVGFVTFDAAVHYYSLRPGSSQAQMMVVGDLNELFVPAPDHLLADLKDSREAVDHFLENLPTMFRLEDAGSHSCLGPALKAAFTISKGIGGRMSLFQASPPSLGEGAVRARMNPRLLGTSDEVTLLRPEVTWYRDTAYEFSKAQIAVDLYLFPSAYLDCASLTELPRLTAGFTKSFPSYDPSHDEERLTSLIYRRLTQPTAFEAVLRIRCTKGMRISRFYGNFHIRGTDLLALPNCNADSVYAFDLGYDEPSPNHDPGAPSMATNSLVTIQSALLYTTAEGERRIRTATQAIRLTSRMEELVGSADAACIAGLWAKQALAHGLKSNLDVARNRLIQSCADVVRSAKDAGTSGGGGAGAFSGGPPGNQQAGGGEDTKIPENLQLLPLYVLSLLKHAGLRGGTDVNPDDRVCARALLLASYVKETIGLIHPRLFAVHDLERQPGIGMPSEVEIDDDGEEKFKDEDGSVAGRERIRLPSTLGLSADSLSSDGIYVLDNGVDTFVWVGRASDPAATLALFGMENLEQADLRTVQLKTQGNNLATTVSTIIQALHEDYELQGVPPVSPKITIVREGEPQLEPRFFWNLVEDRSGFNGGTYTYPEFMQFVNHAQPGGMPPGGGGMAPRGQGGYAPPPPPGAGPPGYMPPNQREYAPPPPSNMPGGPPRAAMPPPPPGPNGGMPPPPSQMTRNAPIKPPGPPSGYGSSQPPMPQPTSGGQFQRTGGGPPPPPKSELGGPPPSTMGSTPSRPPSSGGYGVPPPPASGGYGAPPPPTSGGYGAPPPPASGGYGGPAPPASGGYGGPPPTMGSSSGPPGPPTSGGYRPGPPGPPTSGGFVGNPPGPSPSSGPPGPPTSGGYQQQPGPPGPPSGVHGHQSQQQMSGMPPPPQGMGQMPPPPGQYYQK